MKPLLRATLMLAIAAGALAYALWGVNFARLGKLLADADYRMLAPFLGCLVLFFAFTGWRWNLILRPHGRFTLRQSGPAMMIGFAGNNVLPAHMGELVRAVVFGRQHGVPASGVFVTLVVERMFDVLAILLFYVAAVVTIDPFPPSIRVGAEAVAATTAVGVLTIVAFLARPDWFVALWRHGFAWLPARLHAWGAEALGHAATGVGALRSPGLVAGMAVHSLGKWAAGGAMVWSALAAFDVSLPPGVSMIVVAVVALAVTVPTAPGFIGTMQAAFVIALVPFGVARETAVAASVLFLVAQWIPVTAFGAACFAALGLRLADVRADAERMETRTGESQP